MVQYQVKAVSNTVCMSTVTYTSVWYWMRNFFWSMIGFNDLTWFEVATSAETTAGKVLISIWNFLTVFLLTVLLIALVNNAFDATQNEERATALVTIIRLARIKDMKKSLPLPLPLNLIDLPCRIIVNILRRKRTDPRADDGPDEPIVDPVHPRPDYIFSLATDMTLSEVQPPLLRAEIQEDSGERVEIN
jgi:hypothetical protein